MITPTETLRRIAYLIHRDRYTAELNEEIQLHVDLRAERLRGGGLSPDAARYAAKRRFGNAIHIQERSRDMWGFDRMEQVGADLRFAIRRLRNRPGFAFSAIAVAALGIGATTAVFSAVDAAMLRPLPFLRPSELVTLTNVNIPFDASILGGRPGSQLLSISDVGAMSGVVSATAAFASGGLNLEDVASPRRVKVGVVTANFFSMLGVAPAAGRTFSPEEGRPRGPHAVILSDALWRSQLGGADFHGKVLTLNGRQYDIVGVMPRAFSFPTESDLWIPLTVPTTPEVFDAFRGYLPSRVIARLAPGVSVSTASSQILSAWEHLLGPKVPGRTSNLEEIVDEARTKGAVVPLLQDIVGNRRKALMILMGATLLLLLIACANVANLLISDGAAREREVALREVLGASRGRIVRQLLVESMLLAMAGAAIGLALAPATLGVLRALMPADLVGTAPMHVDLRVLGFATLLALATGMLFGLWPALGTSRADPAEAIKAGGGHGGTAAKLGVARRLLITTELSLTVMLLVGSGLMLRSFHRLMTQDFGMKPEQTGSLELTFARGGAVETAVSGTPARRLQIIHDALDRLAADPAITASGAVNDLPLRGEGGIGLNIETVGVPMPKENLFPRYLIASGGYFNALGITLLQGRTFDATDDTVGERTAIINRSMADAFWPNMSAIGGLFHLNGNSVNYRVIGIIANVREARLDKDAGPQMYFSVDERIPTNIGIVARSNTLPPAELLARLRAAVHAAAPAQAVFNVRTMDAAVDVSVAPRRTNTLLIALFGGLALILSAFGVYAVVSYSVTRRTREFGIRSALGANPADILTLVGGEMIWTIGAGLTIGLFAAWALSRVLSSILFDIQVHDAASFIVAPVALLVPALIAMLVPAIRATRVSVIQVMRAE